MTYSCAKVAAQLPDVYPLGNIEGRVVRALYIDLGEIKYVLDLLPRVPSSIKLYAILRPRRRRIHIHTPSRSTSDDGYGIRTL